MVKGIAGALLGKGVCSKSCWGLGDTHQGARERTEGERHHSPYSRHLDRRRRVGLHLRRKRYCVASLPSTPAAQHTAGRPARKGASQAQVGGEAAKWLEVIRDRSGSEEVVGVGPRGLGQG